MNNKLKILNTIQLEGVLSFNENYDFLIFRKSRSICFYNKNQKKIVKEIPINVDNEFGYKRIETFDNIIFTVIHSKKDPDQPIFGTTDYAEITAYSQEGLLWSRELKGWTITNNYGGFHIINEQLFFIEKIDNQFIGTLLNPSTGNENYTVNLFEINNCYSNPSSKEFVIKKNNTVFAISNYNVYKINISEKSIIPKKIIDRNVLMLSSSNTSITTLLLEEQTYRILNYNTEKESITNEFVIDCGYNINNIKVNKTSHKLIIKASLSEENVIFCYDLLTGKQIWKKVLEEFNEPISYYIDNQDLLHIYYSSFIEEKFQVIDINSGKELIILKSSSEESLTPPILYNESTSILQLNKSLISYKA